MFSEWWTDRRLFSGATIGDSRIRDGPGVFFVLFSQADDLCYYSIDTEKTVKLGQLMLRIFHIAFHKMYALARSALA